MRWTHKRKDPTYHCPYLLPTYLRRLRTSFPAVSCACHTWRRSSLCSVKALEPKRILSTRLTNLDIHPLPTLLTLRPAHMPIARISELSEPPLRTLRVVSRSTSCNVVNDEVVPTGTHILVAGIALRAAHLLEIHVTQVDGVAEGWGCHEGVAVR